MKISDLRFKRVARGKDRFQSDYFFKGYTVVMTACVDDDPIITVTIWKDNKELDCFRFKSEQHKEMKNTLEDWFTAREYSGEIKL